MSCPTCDSEERIITNVYTGKDGLPTETITCLKCGTLEDDGKTYVPALVAAVQAASDKAVTLGPYGVPHGEMRGMPTELWDDVCDRAGIGREKETGNG